MKVIALLVVWVAVAQAAVPHLMYKDVIPGAPPPRTGKIVHGEQATKGQFPHQAAVLADDSAFCGGSLISVNWVMTAAHCTKNFKTFVVTLGQQNRRDDNEVGKVTITSTQAIVHEAYNPSTISSDMALIKLPAPVALSEWIKTVGLPKKSDAGNTYDTEDVTVSGWGLTLDPPGGPLPDQLQFIGLKVISNTECDKYYGAGSTDTTMLCCGAPNGDSTCSGDSGGPLILSGDAKPPVQIGIVSWVSSVGCASGNPSGYVRVTTFLDWIEKNSDVVIEP